MEARRQSLVIESDHHSSSQTLWPLRQALYAESEDDDEENEDELSRTWWVKTRWFQRLVQVCALVSLTSTAMNSPETFKHNNSLRYITLGLDIVVAVVFTTEMIAQINMWGLWRKQKAYFKKPQSIFNASMVFLIMLSILLQIIEISGYIPDNYVAFSVPRAPRALIIVRFFNVLITISLPKSVARRCKRQIWAVTLFLLYFMAFGSIIGVQLFGRKNYYCVKNGADLNNLTYNDLLLTDHRCNNVTGETGYFCPQGFSCVFVDFEEKDKDYFGDFLLSILTVYESSTQEEQKEVCF
ncbi:sodium leak channel non-selective protein-like [Orbicella faveolata]|uniref:sodium leak channel non-selective protein-like n=1 Tax=Orbicella faveolata TaxID=48498 RepID=UPI0009E57536|nr:sodium leak channel non-selective protein-like [Orbicella faveolata]